MLEELKEEEIVNKVGGRLKLSTLIQKRLVALNAGSRQLVDLESDNKLEIVVREIMEDKIYLDAEAKVRIAGEEEGTGDGDGMFSLSTGDLELNTLTEVEAIYPAMHGGDAESFLETVREARLSGYILASG